MKKKERHIDPITGMVTNKAPKAPRKVKPKTPTLTPAELALKEAKRKEREAIEARRAEKRKLKDAGVKLCTRCEKKFIGMAQIKAMFTITSHKKDGSPIFKGECKVCRRIKSKINRR